MNKYFYIYLLKVRNALEFRVNFIITILSSVIPILGTILLWSVIFKDSTVVGGMSYKEVVTYYVLSALLSVLFASDSAWSVADDIRKGIISSRVLLPIGYFRVKFVEYLSEQSFTILIITALGLVSNMLLAGFLTPCASLISFLVFLAYTAVGIVFIFYFSFIMGILAFWFERIDGLYYLQAAIFSIMSGSLIPLRWLPSMLQSLVKFNPFSYIVYYPINTYLYGVAGNRDLQNIFIIILWIIVLHSVASLLWKKGWQAYRAYGG